jgi:hypothetical protein
MTAHPAAALLAQDLGRLPHTNARGERGLIHLPGFLQTAGTNPEQAAETGLLALAISEAIIEDLQKHGYPPTSETDIKARIRAAVAESAQGGEITLYCNRCQRRVISSDVSAPAPRIHVKTAIITLQAHLEQCQ